MVTINTVGGVEETNEVERDLMATLEEVVGKSHSEEITSKLRSEKLSI